MLKYGRLRRKMSPADKNHLSFKSRKMFCNEIHVIQGRPLISVKLSAKGQDVVDHCYLHR